MRITKPKGVFGRVLASKEIKGKSFGRLEATAYGEICRIYSYKNCTCPYHTIFICCEMITPNILACEISHMTFLSVAMSKLYSEIIYALASKLSYIWLFSIKIYSFQNFAGDIYSLPTFPFSNITLSKKHFFWVHVRRQIVSVVKRNHITARYHTAVAFVLLSFSPSDQKDNPHRRRRRRRRHCRCPNNGQARFSRGQCSTRQQARGGGGGGQHPPSPPPLRVECDGKRRRHNSTTPTTIVEHWSPGLERETRERKEEEAHILSRGAITITYSSTTGTCEGCAHHLHERLLKALPRAA